MLFETVLEHSDKLFMATTAICSLCGLYLVRLTKELTRQKQYFALVINSLQEGFYTSSIDGKQLSANPALVRLNGYKSEAELLEAVGNIATEWYVDPQRRDQFRDELMWKGTVSNFVSEVYRHNTRERIWISENARLVCDPVTHEPLHYEGTVREITEEIRLQQSQERLNKLADNLPGGLFQLRLDKDGEFTAPYLSASFIRLLDVDAQHHVNNPNQYLKFIHKDDIAGYMSALAHSAQTLEPLDHKFRFQKPCGDTIWLHTTATPEKSEDDDILWHGYLSDITSQRQAEQRIERTAYFDGLTGLPKRVVLEDKLLSTIAMANRRNDHAAFYVIDLDNLKALNESHGRECGDEVLRQVAGRLQNATRMNDLVARFCSDEFVILIEGLGQDAGEADSSARLFGEKILAEFDKGIDCCGNNLSVAASIGVVLIGEDLPQPEEIIRMADRAVDLAKQKGNRNIVVFGEDKAAKLQTGKLAPVDLKNAVANDQFELLYQPQFSGAGDLVGSEAFIQWNHPQLGKLKQSEFMPLAQRTDAFDEISEWMLTKAISQLANWKTSPQTEKLSLSINLTVRQFSMPDLAERLHSEFLQSGVDPAMLTVEINEWILNRGTENIRRHMKAIGKSDVRFSLDGIGAGELSFKALNKLPFNEVKIDAFLVSTTASQNENRGLIENMLNVAKTLRLEIVADNVNSITQENYLRKLGCTRFQGNCYSMPLSASEFNALAFEQDALKNERMLDTA